MDIAEPWTPNPENDAEGGIEKSSQDFHLEGSPLMPDLLPSTSPKLAQERTGSLSPKHETGMPILSSAPVIEDRLEIDGVLNQCARLLIDSPRNHEVQSDNDKEDEVYPSSTGTPARNIAFFLFCLSFSRGKLRI